MRGREPVPRDGVLVGAEALIRWQHPERGLLSADAFIPLAEQRQLMWPIGQWVVAEAAKAFDGRVSAAHEGAIYTVGK